MGKFLAPPNLVPCVVLGSRLRAVRFDDDSTTDYGRMVNCGYLTLERSDNLFYFFFL